MNKMFIQKLIVIILLYFFSCVNFGIIEISEKWDVTGLPVARTTTGNDPSAPAEPVAGLETVGGVMTGIDAAVTLAVLNPLGLNGGGGRRLKGWRSKNGKS